MARTPWLVDSRGIAMKVKNATQFLDVQKNNWRSDASITCPYCNHQINNDDVTQEWPGLPAGVKFDPSDQELLEHLAAKGGIGNAKPHSFIDEFILTLEEDDGICYTHPEKLPGVKQDGSSIHFFHRTARAYTTGTRKRRKIHNGGDVRWHKTGKTRPVFENGIQKGCKKIMVLYMASLKGSKAEKTNWVMHQYHLGNEEEEKEGEFVVSKVFYQQLPTRQYDKNEPDASVPQEDDGPSISKEVPVTPKTTTPDPPRSGKRHVTPDLVKREHLHCMVSPGKVVEIDETNNQYLKNNEAECEILANANLGNSTWWAGESQLLDDSQQLMDDCLFCDEILENHSCQEKVGVGNCMPCLSECGRIGSDELGKELYQPDASAALENIDLDTPPEVQITDSQFSSQESLLGWLNKNTDWLINDKAPGKSSLNLGDTQCSI